MSRILVTGSAGFIGRHVCDLLIARGHTVTGVDNFDRQVHGEFDRRRVRPWEWATTVGNATVQWAKDSNVVYDAVIHLAAAVGVGQSAYKPAHYIEQNVLETARLWEAIIARRVQVRRVVVASSMAVYGEGTYVCATHRALIESGVIRVIEDSWDTVTASHTGCSGQRLLPCATTERKIAEPRSVYAQTKYDAERYSLLLGEAYSVPTVALRFFNVAGPGQAIGNGYTGCIMNFLSRIVNGQPPLVTEDGKQRRDFVNVRDVARAIVDAIEASEFTGVYNVGSGVATEIGGLAEELCAITSARGLPPVAPQILFKYRRGDVRHCVSDSSAIDRAIGWHTEIGLTQTLSNIVDWVVRDKIVVPDPMPRVFAELEERGLIGA